MDADLIKIFFAAKFLLFLQYDHFVEVQRNSVFSISKLVGTHRKKLAEYGVTFSPTFPFL